jgi:hypothetical protein
MIKSWQTTLSGIGVIFGVLGKAIAEFTAGGIAAVDFGVLFAGVAAGIGLIAAKDKNVTGGTKKQ